MKNEENFVRVIQGEFFLFTAGVLRTSSSRAIIFQRNFIWFPPSSVSARRKIAQEGCQVLKWKKRKKVEGKIYERKLV